MNSAKCRACGFVGWADAEVCKKCGADMFSDVPQSFAPLPGSLPTSDSPYSVQPQLKTGLAVTALVLGVLNFLLFGIFVIPTIVGIIISVIALNKIKRNPHEYGGKGMAVGGLVVNIVCAVFLIPVLIIAAIAIPNLMAARRAANEGAAIRSLRTIHAAEQTYQATSGRGRYGNLSDLQRDSLISSDLASGTKSGYRFKLEVIPSGRNGLSEFEVVAIPTDYGSTGRRSFFIDNTGVIRGEDSHGLDATSSAPPLAQGRQYEDPRLQTRRPSNNFDDE